MILNYIHPQSTVCSTSGPTYTLPYSKEERLTKASLLPYPTGMHPPRKKVYHHHLYVQCGLLDVGTSEKLGRRCFLPPFVVLPLLLRACGRARACVSVVG